MTRLEGADLKVSLSVEPGWTIRASQGDEFVRLAVVPVAFDSLLFLNRAPRVFPRTYDTYHCMSRFVRSSSVTLDGKILLFAGRVAPSV